VAQSRAIFVKMVGPRSIVEPEIPAFTEFAASLRPREASSTAPARTQTAASTTSADNGGFDWTAPDEWERAPARSMRLVTYFAGGDTSAECYVSLLPGDGGGLESNLNRWYEQMGVQPLSPEEIEAYIAKVRAWIDRHKTYPGMARRRGIEADVTIRLDIAPDGAVRELSTSGDAPGMFRSATEDAVARAAPFPEPPAGFGTLEIGIRYQMER